jgi:peptidyl-prolyl cis-trans isomerase D
MISFFRNVLSSWFAIFILAFIIVAVVVTGVFTSPFTSGSATVVARVGAEKVDEAAYIAALQRRLSFVQREQPTFTQAQLFSEKIDQAVLDELVQRAGITQALDTLGIVTAQSTFDKTISEIPAFQAAGRFSKDQYQRVLAENRLTIKEFEEGVGLDLALQQLQAPIGKNWSMPQNVVLAYANALSESRTAITAIIPAQLMTDIPAPDDKTLQAFYTQRKEDFAAPENRSFRYFTVNANTLAPRIAITEAELQAAFRERAAEFGSVEVRSLQQVLLDTQAAAQTLIKRVQAGEDFAAVAQTLVPGLTAADISRGDVDERALGNELSAPIAKAVFSLPQGGVSAPLQSDLGWYVFRVAAIKPAKTGQFEAAREKLTTDLRAAKAVDALYALTKELDDAAIAKKSFEDLAKIAGTQVQTFANVQANGQAASGSAPVPVANGILPLVFAHTLGEALRVEEIASNEFAVVEVTDIKERTIRPLSDVRAAVTAAWLRQRQLLKARSTAQQLVAQVKAGKSLSDAATALKIPVQPPITLRREQLLQAGPNAPALFRTMFKINAGDAILDPLPQNAGFAVLHVTQVSKTPLAQDDPRLPQLRNEFTQLLNLEVREQFVRSAYANRKVQFNQNAIAQVRRNLLSTGQ